MNAKLLLICSAALACSLAACSQPASTPVSPVVGTWTGRYTSGSTPVPTTGPINYAFIIRADGTMNVYNGPIGTGLTANGTWTYDGSHFKGTYTYQGTTSTYSVDSTLATPNRLAGTWGSGSNTTNGGNFAIDRQ